MRQRIMASFSDEHSLEEAIKAVKELGFNDYDIAVFTKEGQKSLSDDGKILADNDTGEAYTFSDIGTGILYDDSLASMLINLGVPPNKSQYFSGKMQEGKKLLFVQADANEEAAADCIRNHGAEEVSLYTDYNAGLA